MTPTISPFRGGQPRGNPPQPRPSDHAPFLINQTRRDPRPTAFGGVFKPRNACLAGRPDASQSLMISKKMAVVEVTAIQTQTATIGNRYQAPIRIPSIWLS